MRPSLRGWNRGTPLTYNVLSILTSFVECLSASAGRPSAAAPQMDPPSECQSASPTPSSSAATLDNPPSSWEWRAVQVRQGHGVWTAAHFPCLKLPHSHIQRRQPSTAKPVPPMLPPSVNESEELPLPPPLLQLVRRPSTAQRGLCMLSTSV